ncbi:hypothetical protein [Sporolituus thermophilus]|uniref:Iron-only hydrogenase system regulator n=1 Tax=Sporolituus thermophilus DSM 23256 TaxID=1123285 RepID=A0A1G7KJ05_9FIRM|nr:hypothetical protein [Sporolituus thermophilus]SDF37071.1 hypothetical protein SAMN05660235_01367 [Sporolituus thermophilus DSM 23256]
MLSNCSVIMAILQENRTETAPKVQDILTRYGCYIRVRLGLHDAALEGCTNTGLILLQLCGDDVPVSELEKELTGVPHVKVKSMRLDF